MPGASPGSGLQCWGCSGDGSVGGELWVPAPCRGFGAEQKGFTVFRTALADSPAAPTTAAGRWKHSQADLSHILLRGEFRLLQIRFSPPGLVRLSPPSGYGTEPSDAFLGWRGEDIQGNAFPHATSRASLSSRSSAPEPSAEPCRTPTSFKQRMRNDVGRREAEVCHGHSEGWRVPRLPLGQQRLSDHTSRGWRHRTGAGTQRDQHRKGWSWERIELPLEITPKRCTVAELRICNPTERARARPRRAAELHLPLTTARLPQTPNVQTMGRGFHPSLPTQPRSQVFPLLEDEGIYVFFFLARNSVKIEVPAHTHASHQLNQRGRLRWL